MAAPLLLDLSHTSHTRARTGIQRVARSLLAELGSTALGVTYDPFFGDWRALEAWENRNLSANVPAASRGARWPLSAKIQGRARRILRQTSTVPTPARGLIAPELFSPAVGASYSSLRRRVDGPAIAVFHDAIALKYPELTPAKTVARLPGYLQELLQFDGIAATSDESRDTLIAYWRWLGVTHAPSVRAIPLGVDRIPLTTGLPPDADPGTAPLVLCVSSIEGRKNHLALLDACERLWDQQVRFTLMLIGVANHETGAAARARIERLSAAGKPITYAGPATDESLAHAYRACAFTVYPSLAEGYGLPVFESIAHGKPCICSARGALGEAARGGGCLTLGDVSSEALAGALTALIQDSVLYRRLAAEAAARPVRTWSDYARDISDWIVTLSPRPSPSHFVPAE